MIRLLTIPQAAKEMAISAYTAGRLARNGVLPRVVIGKRIVRIPEQAVSEFIKQRTIGGTK